MFEFMKHIPLKKGLFALVDDRDYFPFMEFKWRVDTQGYAVRDWYVKDNSGKRRYKVHRMHHCVLGRINGLEVDHKSGNRLDNRRDNLRFCTRTENSRNMRKRKSSSRFKGVVWNKYHNKWTARIKIDGKAKFLGHFEMEDEAGMAYRTAALRYFGEFARF